MNNKWTCTVTKQANGKYSANLEQGGVVVNGLSQNVDYNTLKQSIINNTGIVILKHKDMLFERISKTKQIATIDATQTRKDCRVTIEDRVSGWKPDFS